ncbi:hypothetical protein [Piscirickettsia litoralis]|uniref:hypothetical protein n=1 Tax=Piscirickettsia litoralis TaxID=1891921 RepID=UPI001112FDD4|nr:hypothetical protein [Piscirickettsia litoralis]
MSPAWGWLSLGLIFLISKGVKNTLFIFTLLPCALGLFGMAILSVEPGIFFGNLIERIALIIFSLLLGFKFIVSLKEGSFIDGGKVSRKMFLVLVFFSIVVLLSIVAEVYYLRILSTLYGLSYYKVLIEFLSGISIAGMMAILSFFKFKEIFILALPSVLAVSVSSIDNVFVNSIPFLSIVIASYIGLLLLGISLVGLYFWYLDYQKEPE